MTRLTGWWSVVLSQSPISELRIGKTDSVSDEARKKAIRDRLARYAEEYLVYARSKGCLVRQQSSWLFSQGQHGGENMSTLSNRGWCTALKSPPRMWRGCLSSSGCSVDSMICLWVGGA